MHTRKHTFFRIELKFMLVDLVKLKQNPREIVKQYLDRFKEAREKYWSSIPIKKTCNNCSTRSKIRIEKEI